MISSNSDSDYTTKQSKLDKSGTDPNRYGGYYSEEQAKELGDIDSPTKSVIPGFNVNISTVERFMMVALGTYFVYRGIASKGKGIASTFAGSTLLARGITGYCPVYDATNNKDGKINSSDIDVKASIYIDRPVSEVYAFYRKLENLPKFMSHLESVEEISKSRSKWTAKGPIGIGRISWEAEILHEEKDKMLSWHSLPDSTVDNSGRVTFSAQGQGTDLDVNISYRAPFGIAGEKAAQWLNPYLENMVKKDVEDLKDYLETGKESR